MARSRWAFGYDAADRPPRLDAANEEQRIHLRRSSRDRGNRGRKAELTLAQNQLAFKSFQNFTVRKTLKQLESQVIGAPGDARLRHDQASAQGGEADEIPGYDQALHDSVRRTTAFSSTAIDPAARWKCTREPQCAQGQKLFDLPDLSKMEIVALLHETIVNRIKPGMPVRVRIEALPEAGEMYGRVSKVDSMPYNGRKREGANNGNAAASEITYFLGHMELDKTIPGLKPGMSAEIEILAERGPGVLAVPIEAVVREDDVDVCYVTHLDPSLPHERQS